MEHAWIAASDDEIAAVLNHPDMHTRPTGQLVPASIAGTAFGNLYGRLVRMNDGARHAALRRMVEERLATWDLDAIGQLAQSASRDLAPRDIAPFVLGTMIGMRDVANAIPAIWDFAVATGGGATEEQLARGIPAAERLLERLPDDDDLDVRANLLGFLFQSATTIATLIDNRLGGETRAPVPFTRRWAAVDVELCGRTVHRGELVIALLASSRFGYGSGRHRCPGEAIANAIADAAVHAFTSSERRRAERSPAHQPV